MNFGSLLVKMNSFGLNEGELEQNQAGKSRQIEKTFDYEEDIEELGKKLDKENRTNLSKEECDSLYLAGSDILDDINAILIENKDNFEEHLEEIKRQAGEEEALFSSEEFDIFGGMTEDKTKINTLGKSKHREIKKSTFRLLDINKSTENFQYVENLKNIALILEKAIDKAHFGVKLNSFYAGADLLATNQKYTILYINPQDALNTALDTSDKITLYNIKLKEDTKAIALTNIVYYENRNQTLPLRNGCLR